MPRFVAVAEAPNLSEESFRAALGTMRKWRFDRRAWIVKAYSSQSDASVVVECEAPNQAQFEGWLRDSGWQARSIKEVELVFEDGTIWPLNGHHKE